MPIRSLWTKRGSFTESRIGDNGPKRPREIDELMDRTPLESLGVAIGSLRFGIHVAEFIFESSR